MHGLAIEHPPAPVSGDVGAAHAFTKVDVSHRAVPASRARLGGKIAWCAAGFMIGAAFWHLVGFWSFVSYAVLGDSGSGEPLASARFVSLATADQTPARAKPLTGGRPSCITLALDRTTGQTRPEPCDATTPALPHVAASAREDLALLPDQSSPTILPHFPPKPAAPSLSD